MDHYIREWNKHEIIIYHFVFCFRILFSITVEYAVYDVSIVNPPPYFEWRQTNLDIRHQCVCAYLTIQTNAANIEEHVSTMFLQWKCHFCHWHTGKKRRNWKYSKFSEENFEFVKSIISFTNYYSNISRVKLTKS